MNTIKSADWDLIGLLTFSAIVSIIGIGFCVWLMIALAA